MPIDIFEALAREYPNGVSFDPLAVRLMRRRVSLEDFQIEELKKTMFQLGDGLWFSFEMIFNDNSRRSFNALVQKWLKEYGYFCIGRLFEIYSNATRHAKTQSDYAIILESLGYTSKEWKGSFFCFDAQLDLDKQLSKCANIVSGWLEGAGGTLPLEKIKERVPHLTFEALETLRIHFLEGVYVAEVRNIFFWRNAESIALPEDFSEKVTDAVNTLVAIGEKVTFTKLEFALNLSYKIRFCEEYGLQDKDDFMHICAEHYQGDDNYFPTLPNKIKRTRSPNTQFNTLDVPIGAHLTFKSDEQISCVVADDINQVEYEGKQWSISSLAIHLLGVQSANGFCYFVYDGETLWDRRVRMHQGG